MKKTLLLLLFFSITTILFAQSLQEMWNAAMDYNQEIQEAEYQYDVASIKATTLEGAYALGVSLDSAVKYSEKLFNPDDVPDSWSNSINLYMPLLGNAAINVSASYSLMADPFNPNNSVIQSPGVSLGISQGLFPFWITGRFKDPYKEQYRINSLISDAAVSYYKMSILLSLANYYISLRQTLREIENYRNTINYLNVTISSLKQMLISGSVSVSKLVESEKQKWEYEKKLLDLQLQRSNIEETLINLCGIKNKNILDDELPSFDKEDIYHKYLKTISNPEIESLFLQLSLIDTQTVLRKQNEAPVLSAQISVNQVLESCLIDQLNEPWNKEKETTWALSISLDMSPFLSSLYKKNKQIEDINKNSVLMQIGVAEQRIEAILNSIKGNLYQINESITFLDALIANLDTVYEDMRLLYDRQGCSESDLLAIEVQLLSQKSVKANLEDSRWYNSFLLSIYSLNDK